MIDNSTSKNHRANLLCGQRPPGSSIITPHELGYACPLCGADDEVNLDWSEYNYFLWCKQCNLDIPSCLCVKYYEPKLIDDEMTDKQKIERATEIFLDCIEGVLKRGKP